MKTAFARASLAAFLTAPFLGSAALAEPAEFQFDKTHTVIKASWDHGGYSTMPMYFTDYDGVLLLDLEEPSNSTVDVTFNLADGFWVGPNQERFIGHLNTADFFNIEEFPTARFVATSFETEDGETGTMTGDLTLLGETRPVSLDVKLNKAAENRWGTYVAGFDASGTLTRADWGMDYATGGTTDDITIEISTELQMVTDEAE